MADTLRVWQWVEKILYKRKMEKIIGEFFPNNFSFNYP